MNRECKLLFTAAALIALTPMCARSAPPQHHTRMPILLAAGLEGSIGSTVGPDGAFYLANHDARPALALSDDTS